MSVEPRTLAYSPCPNDTYVFAAWTNGLLADAVPPRVTLDDIDALNAAALGARHDLVKVSYGAIPHLLKHYRILRSGGALGRGCGPLVIAARPGENLEALAGRRIAIPGERTTAHLLLRLALRSPVQAVVMRFDRIVEAVASGEVEAGLIIHESRFTYQEHGLARVIDLGEWWEAQTGLPIPLGAILARREMSEGERTQIEEIIRRSLAFARAHESAVMPYVRAHAAEMRDDVMRRHIETYVNEYTNDIGDDGAAAVEELLARARGSGLLPDAETATVFS